MIIILIICALWACLGFVGMLACMGASRLATIREDYGQMCDADAEINEPITEIISNRFRNGI